MVNKMLRRASSNDFAKEIAFPEKFASESVATIRSVDAIFRGVQGEKPNREAPLLRQVDSLEMPQRLGTQTIEIPAKQGLESPKPCQSEIFWRAAPKKTVQQSKRAKNSAGSVSWVPE